MKCNCKDYNGGQCYNCINGAHNTCSGKHKCNAQTKTVKAWIRQGELDSVIAGHYGIMYGKNGIGRIPCVITYKLPDTGKGEK